MGNGTCSVVENGVPCMGIVKARGWCAKHYMRWQMYRDPLFVMDRRSPPCPVVEYGVVCGGAILARGLCGMHYQRERKTGDPLVLRRTAIGAPMVWLEAAVATRDRSSCWCDWPFGVKRGRTGDGYPMLGGRPAGHIAMILDGRPKPADIGGHVDMCHSLRCSSSLCLNPDDLRWDTRAENMKDRNRAGQVYPCLYGEAIPSAKLTEDAVRNIRLDYASGRISQRKLATRYGITQTTVWAVVNRQRWTHVL